MSSQAGCWGPPSAIGPRPGKRRFQCKSCLAECPQAFTNDSSRVTLAAVRQPGTIRSMATDPMESLQPSLDAGHYGTGAIVFHWSVFLLVVVVGSLGLLHDDWPKQTQAFWINVHAMIGFLLWFVLLARIGWLDRKSVV